MFAWRARIGLIKPTHRGKSFHFWYQHAPEGVEIVPTFIGFRSGKKESFLNAFERAEQLAADLKVKVVWALAAEMWFTYHKLAVSNRVEGCGILLGENPVPAS